MLGLRLLPLLLQTLSRLALLVCHLAPQLPDTQGQRIIASLQTDVLPAQFLRLGNLDFPVPCLGGRPRSW